MHGIDTVFSVDSVLDYTPLNNAKDYMTEKYGNKYSFTPAHLSYAITPMAEDCFEEARKEFDRFANDLHSFSVNVSGLMVDERDKLFYIKIEGDNLYNLHTKVTKLLNSFRKDAVRNKDLERLKKGEFDELEKNYLQEFGYIRVMERYKSHITIGNITNGNEDYSKVRKELEVILKDIINKELYINNIHGVFHTDSSNQREMREIWSQVYSLQT